MLFEWDTTKAIKNLHKHKISFELASTVFNDSLHLSIVDPDSINEERWITIGRSADGRTPVVVHTELQRSEEGEFIRIISARKTTRKEQKEYEEGI